MTATSVNLMRVHPRFRQLVIRLSSKNAMKKTEVTRAIAGFYENYEIRNGNVKIHEYNREKQRQRRRNMSLLEEMFYGDQR